MDMHGEISAIFEPQCLTVGSIIPTQNYLVPIQQIVCVGATRRANNFGKSNSSFSKGRFNPQKCTLFGNVVCLDLNIFKMLTRQSQDLLKMLFSLFFHSVDSLSQ